MGKPFCGSAQPLSFGRFGDEKALMNVPPLIHDFRHARINSVAIGPRRELALSVAPLVWNGTNGHHGDGVSLRFGGIENFTEVSAFFSDEPQQRSELQCLRYAQSRPSKQGCLFFELSFERIEAKVIIQCSNLQIDDLDE
jgi:hypothetical protein